MVPDQDGNFYRNVQRSPPVSYETHKIRSTILVQRFLIMSDIYDQLNQVPLWLTVVVEYQL